MNKSSFLALRLILLSSFFFFGGFLYLLLNNYRFKVSDDVIFYSLLDFILSSIVIYITCILYRKKILLTLKIFEVYSLKLTRYGIFIFFGCIYGYFLVYRNFKLVIFQGFNREALVALDANNAEFLLSNIFFILVPVSILYKYSWKVRWLIITGALSFLIYQLARSPLLLILYITALLIILKEIKLNVKKLLIPATFLLLSLGIITQYQGRADNITEGILNVTDALFRYRSYSFFLSQFVIDLPYSIDKSLFPFFGWFSERLLTEFWEIQNPISTSGSDFVYRYRYVSGYRPNVLYPWWVFFYSNLGILGIFLKAIFSFILFRSIILLKSPLLLIYFLFIISYLQFVRHPIINSAGAYSLLSVIILDIILKIGNEKNRNYRPVI